MKLYLSFLLCLLSVLSSSAKDNEKIVPSSIKQVTVYLNGAQVIRHAKVSVPQGTTNLVFAGLAATIDKNRIQVGVSDPAVITSVAYRNNMLRNQVQSDRYVKMLDSLELIDNAIAEVSSLNEVLLKEEDIILSNKSIGGAQTGVNINDLKAGVAFMSSRMAAIKKEMLSNNLRLKKLNLIRSKLSYSISEESVKMNKVSYEIIVEVNSGVSGEVDVELTYMVGSASWLPRYDIRSKDVQSQVELVYRADISQQTGEDWKNVKLILSTGNPNISANKPYMAAKEINKLSTYKNMNRIDYRSAPSAYESADDKANYGDLSQYNHVLSNTLSTLFEIGLPANVYSEAGSQNVEVQKYKLKASYEYQAVPKLDRDAFLTARVTGWEDFSLLGGAANVFFANTFIGETYINPSIIKDTLDISLGRDKKIIIKRSKLKDLCTTTLIGNKRKEQYTYEITVKNTKSTAVEIIVEDQVPVSRDGDVDVDLSDKGGATYDEASGKLKWILKIEPGGTARVQFGFQIKYPKDRVIPGL